MIVRSRHEVKTKVDTRTLLTPRLEAAAKQPLELQLRLLIRVLFLLIDSCLMFGVILFSL